MRWIAPLTLALALAAPPADAGDPTGLGAVRRAAAESPYDLDHIVGSTLLLDHWPLEAGLMVDPDDRLLARVLVAIVDRETKAQAFERWEGYVEGAGWVPERRTLTEEPELARARHLLALLDQRRLALSAAVRGAVRDDENPTRPADLVLSAAPTERDGAVQIGLAVIDGGELASLDYDPQRPAYRRNAEKPALDLRAAVLERTLPPLAVAGGTWFNVAEAPAPGSWRGRPILVVTTDPG